MKLKGGIKEAAKILQGLDPDMRKTVLEQMIAKNPDLAHEIQNQMVTFEDLKYLTPSMMRDLMRHIDMDDFALALRGQPREFSDKILSLVSVNIRKDMQDILQGPPKALSEVQTAMEKIMSVVKPMCERGELILTPDDETYV